MTELEINRAIATKIGVNYNKPTEKEVKSGSYFQYEPNYYISLDTCVNFERTLDILFDEYYNQLWIIVKKSNTEKTLNQKLQRVVCATAPQRCEAFLRLHNLWID